MVRVIGGFKKSKVASTGIKSKENEVWFELLGSSRNQEFKKSGFHCMLSVITGDNVNNFTRFSYLFLSNLIVATISSKTSKTLWVDGVLMKVPFLPIFQCCWKIKINTRVHCGEEEEEGGGCFNDF